MAQFYNKQLHYPLSGSFTGSFSGVHSGSLFGTASQALTASYLVGAAAAVGFPYTGSAQITGSLGITGSLNVSGTISAQLTNVSQSNFVAYNTTTGLFTYANTGSFTATSASYSATASYAVTASYVNPLRQTVIISGSLIISASTTPLSIQGSGSNVFSVDGTSGRLFQIDDSLSGSLFSVNTAAGLPVIEAFSDNTVRIGQFGQKALFVSQSRVGVGTEIPTTNLDVSGSGRFTNGLFLSGSVQITGSLGVTGSINSTGNITTTGTLIAQTLIVQTITSSIEYSSGSNIFGSQLTDRQTFTGSMFVTGSATIVGRVTATDLTGSLFGTASQAITASYLLGGVSAQVFPYSGSAQITGSLGITGSLSINGSLLLGQNTSSLGISTQTVSTNATASYTSAFYKYTLASGSNARAGQMIAVWSGSAIQYMDNSTTDIGNTSLVALTASLSSGNVLLTTVLPTAGWTVKTLVNLL